MTAQIIAFPKHPRPKDELVWSGVETEYGGIRVGVLMTPGTDINDLKARLREKGMPIFEDR